MRYIFSWALVSLLFVSCAPIKDQIDARTALKEAKFSLQSVTIDDIEFGDTLFSPRIEKITFAVLLDAQNNANHDMVIDSYALNLLLDDTQLASFAHQGAVKVSSKQSKSIKALVTPGSFDIKKVFDTKVIKLAGEVKASISLIGNILSVPTTLPIETSVSTEKLITQIKEQLKNKLRKTLPLPR